MFEHRQDTGLELLKQPLQSLRVPRHSGGWATLRKRLETEQGLRVLDVGATSASNINYLTDQGHSLFMVDPVREAVAGSWMTAVGEEGEPTWNIQEFLDQAFHLTGRPFDMVLLWTALDYLPEALVAPVVQRLFEHVTEGGQVLAFFHIRTTGEEAAYCRFHVSPTDDVLMQTGEPYPIQQAFTNRSVERLFTDWSGQKCFLAKDAVSEVLVTR